MPDAMPTDIPSNANLLPWMIAAMVAMFGGMLIWVRSLVDTTIKDNTRAIDQMKVEILHQLGKIRDGNLDIAVAMTILSLAIKSPGTDVSEMGKSHLKKLEAKQTDEDSNH